MKLTLIKLLLCFFLSLAPGSAYCQSKGNGSTAWLDVIMNDIRLNKAMTFDLGSGPRLDELFDLVTKATGVPLTLAEPPENAKVMFGGAGSSGGRAWQVMRHVAGSYFKEGRWEKKGDGYARLIPTSP